MSCTSGVHPQLQKELSLPLQTLQDVSQSTVSADDLLQKHTSQSKESTKGDAAIEVNGTSAVPFSEIKLT